MPQTTSDNPKQQMFANPTSDEASTEDDDQSSTDGNQYFDERSQIHETYWVAVDCNRRSGPQILQHDDLSVSDTDTGVSGAVDDYRYFNDEKQELIEEITGELDMYGLRKYREDFDEPSEEMWTEGASEHFGINIVGVHKIPQQEAKEEYNVDYTKSDVDPVFVPILETEDGEEVIYSPVDFYDSDESQGETTESTETTEVTEPDFPSDPPTTQEYLESKPLSDLNKQERSTLAKLRDPKRTNREIANDEDIDCSKNTVRKGLQKHLGENGYKNIKARGKQMRSMNKGTDYEEQMTPATDGGKSGDTVEVDAQALAELEGRVERLESMFDAELLERV